MDAAAMEMDSVVWSVNDGGMAVVDGTVEVDPQAAAVDTLRQ